MREGVDVYIALGANQGDPAGQLKRARASVSTLAGTTVRRCSSMYRTAPVGFDDQPDFINAVCALETTLSPRELLLRLQGIEKAQGRLRSSERNGPRTLDLDILLYSGVTIATRELEIPHPRMLDRAFVVVPLLEIAPDLSVPGFGMLKKYRQITNDQKIKKLDISWSE